MYERSFKNLEGLDLTNEPNNSTIKDQNNALNDSARKKLMMNKVVPFSPDAGTMQERGDPNEIELAPSGSMLDVNP